MIYRRPTDVMRVSDAGLRRFFARLVYPGFVNLGVADAPVTDYVVDVLARFTRVDQLYRIRDQRGQRLETIAEMLMEIAQLWSPERRYSMDRELSIRQHCGDYALFMSGLFRAHVEADSLLDYYLMQGQQAYRSVADLGAMAHMPGSRIFMALSDQFEPLSGALDYVRKVRMRPEMVDGEYAEIVRGLNG